MIPTTPPRPRRSLSVMLLALLTMGCGALGDPDDGQTPPPTAEEATPTSEPTPPPGTATPPPGTATPPPGTATPPPGTATPPPGTATPPEGTSPLDPPGDPTPPPGRCREDADCAGDFGDEGEWPPYCVGPDDAPGYDVCGEGPPPDECFQDSDCLEVGQICESISLYTPGSGCSYAPGTSYMACVQGCNPQDPDSCGDLERCNAETLRCELISCTEGTIQCSAAQTCTAGSGGNDCARDTCDVNTPGQCGEGNTCISGRCYVAGCEQEPAPCASPEFEGCTNTADDGGYHCDRKHCTSDASCGFDGALCVEGLCATSWGVCEQDVAYP